MSGLFKKRVKILTLFQIIIFLLSLISYHEISLLSYINISFYISLSLLLASLLIYTIHTGFFDVMFKSFNFAFSKGEHRRKWEDVPSLSELVSLNNRPLLFYGLTTGAFMAVALFFYYV
jgi:hypothetical protein